MGKNNKKAKQALIEIYGEECFIDKLKLRPKPTKGEYKGKGQKKRMKQLTYHHILEKRNRRKSYSRKWSNTFSRKSPMV